MADAALSGLQPVEGASGETAAAKPDVPLSTAQLLQLLRMQQGREYQAFLRRSATLAPTCYTFAYSSQGVQATGPSQQKRVLSAEQFTALFGYSTFVQVAPTGHLTDLGPLFEGHLHTPSPPLDTD